MAGQTRTRNEAVHDDLREDILRGRWEPGQKLGFAELGATYNASVGVIREALARLVEQGLVESRPQQGFSVADLTATDLVNITELRCSIEDDALRAAIAQGTLTWESEVLAVHHRLENTPMCSPSDPSHFSREWVRAHAEFHDVLLLGGSNSRLLSIAAQLGRAVQVYCCWLTRIPDPKTRDIVAEHRAIAEATVARDADRAVELLITHIRLTADNMLDNEGRLKPVDSELSGSQLLDIG